MRLRRLKIEVITNFLKEFGLDHNNKKHRRKVAKAMQYACLRTCTVCGKENFISPVKGTLCPHFSIEMLFKQTCNSNEEPFDYENILLNLI